MTRGKSILPETGQLVAGQSTTTTRPNERQRPQSVRFRSKDEIHVYEEYIEEDVVNDKEGVVEPLRYQETQALPKNRQSIMYRFGAALLLVAAVLPILHSTTFFGHNAAIPIQGVNGGPIPEEASSRMGARLEERTTSPVHVCFRWAQMSALVNGTLYLYGGQATTEPSQVYNTWNNYFLTLDVSKTWKIDDPPLAGLPDPSGPPAVALGYLWNSRDSLYLYGGEFSWKPPVSPVPFATWEYHIPTSQWIEHSDPVTSQGKSSPSGDVPVQRAAEGAGMNVPSLGRGFYFGGHLDGYTTAGWSQEIPRVYLQSLLEFTFPGYSNQQVTSLQNGNTAGSSGVYRNITEGGLQRNYGFTQRADGLLIYVPGFGAEGILLALAGGTNVTFTQMNEVNVYDIATSSWYTQSTSGPTPGVRVNPCAVIAAALDGSSYNIYMFGGQNLTPAGNQTQYQDMWILSLPSFQWIKVDQSGQSVPYGSTGATCNIWDAQMIMVGGYNSQLSCENPAMYVFNLSSLTWNQQFTSLPKGLDNSPKSNPFNQQPNQRAEGNNPGGLEGSYGYEVPEIVISKIGGNQYGGATITTPVVTATAGPLATGSAATYTVTVTGPHGGVVTETGSPGSPGSVDTGGSGGPNIAAIVVGVVCGVLFIVICYLLFCLFIYRKQLKLYKRHVDMAQRQARGEKPEPIPGLWNTDSGTASTDRHGFLAAGENASKAGSGPSQSGGSGAQTGSSTAVGGSGYQSVRRTSDQSSTEDLLSGNEPTFVGVMLNPRRSLRVINRD